MFTGGECERMRVGIVGYGHLGQYLVRRIMDPSSPTFHAMELVFVWNRTPSTLDRSGELSGFALRDDQKLRSLSDMHRYVVDVVVEVAHPSVYAELGDELLRHGHLLCGSPTSLAHAAMFERLREMAVSGSFGLYLPAGALWGVQDIAKMGEQKTIAAASITMTKPAESLRLEEPLQSVLKSFVADGSKDELVLYEGPVRELCHLAPSNVNTMACLAVASGVELGFDRVVGRLVADKRIAAHIIDIEVIGKAIPGRNDTFRVTTRRYNPCDPAEVTASATYPSFFSSLLKMVHIRRNGVHFI